MMVAYFPGQGSQHVGMGRFLYDNFSVARLLFEEASDTLKVSFKSLCFDGPEGELNLTVNAQPAILLVSFASFQVLREIRPFEFSMTMGHSVGEYSALVATEALRFIDGLKALKARGQAMQEAVPVGVGGMTAALGLNAEQCEDLCRWVVETSKEGPLSPANFNGPGQVVLSGSLKAIEWLEKAVQTGEDSTLWDKTLKPRFKLIRLNVSAPFHCALMKPAEEKMRVVLDSIEFKSPFCPVVQNNCARAISDPQLIRENLKAQITAPVRWEESAERLKENKFSKGIEFGPGRVIQGLMKKIDSSFFTTFNINSLEDLGNLERMDV